MINGNTKYVGRSIELHNGGFRKRLSDYRRQSDSARTHSSGRTINENLDRIRTYILIVGNTDYYIYQLLAELEQKQIGNSTLYSIE